VHLRKYNEFEDPSGLWLGATTKIFMMIPYHDPPIDQKGNMMTVMKQCLDHK